MCQKAQCVCIGDRPRATALLIYTISLIFQGNALAKIIPVAETHYAKTVQMELIVAFVRKATRVILYEDASVRDFVTFFDEVSSRLRDHDALPRASLLMVSITVTSLYFHKECN